MIFLPVQALNNSILIGYIITVLSLQHVNYKTISISRSISHLVDFLQLLNDHRAGGSTTIADGCHTVFTGLQLVEKGDENTGA